MMRYLLILLYLSGMFSSCRDNSAPKTAAGTPSSRSFHTPEWAYAAVLYECNVRQFSQEGNFTGLRAQLERLKELGIDVLWLMPVHPVGVEKRKGGLGSPYSAVDYRAVNPDYGTEEDLKNLVREAHNLGLKVILDWVPNHTAWDAVWKTEHPDFYTRVDGKFIEPLNERGESTGWTDVCDLNYDNREMRGAMIAAMRYWVEHCDIDGFRVDMAGLVPNDFWMEVRPALDSVKPLFMLSEWQDEPAHFTSCFDANYGWKWKDVTKDIWTGKQNARSLDTLYQFLNEFYPPGYFQLYFTQNHDENSWNGTEEELYGASADAFNVLAFTWQGMPMLYNGQEDGLSQRLAFFEKDPILWKDYAKTPFFQALCDLKHKNKALRAGAAGGKLVKIPTDADEYIYAFCREKDGDKVVVILNLSKQTRSFNLKPPTEAQGEYSNLFAAGSIRVTREMTLSLPPWEYLILTNK